MQINATQIINFIEEKAHHAGPFISSCIQSADQFVRDHVDDLNDLVPKDLTQNFSKEWAETIPIAVLSVAALYTGWKAFGACRKAISATAWCGAAAATSMALLLAIKHTNLNPIK